MVSHLTELITYRQLLGKWVVRDVKIRYKQSLLGIFWAILQPLAITLIFSLIFSRIVRVPTDGAPYPLFYFAAIMPWVFFSSSIGFAAPSLVNNLSLVTKVYFPREIIPISSIMASFVDFCFAGLVYAGMMVLYRAPVNASFLLLPVLVTLQILLSLGVGLILAALNVSYRDVRFVVPVALQLWLYLTPVIYPVSMIPERFRGLYLLNPMAGVIDAYRQILVWGQMPAPASLLPALVISMATIIGAYAYFKWSEAEFADVI